MDGLQPKARRGLGDTGTDEPVRRLLPPRAFETVPELVPWAEERRKISLHPFVFRDPAGTLESLTGHTTAFFPFLGAA